jgi:hypothetical protein
MYENNFIRSRIFLVIVSALCGGIAAGDSDGDAVMDDRG